jgi:hypothetical protein
MTLRLPLAALGFLLLVSPLGAAEKTPALVRSARSGPWSAGATWEGGQVPASGVKVQVRASHAITYDVKSDAVIRSIHIAGTLSFARDRDTRLCAGLIKIQPGDDTREEGFDCEAHVGAVKPGKPRPALEVGTPEAPVPAGRTAVIRLVYVAGMDKQSCPAIVCCGGRMDFHGAPLSRTWVKLGADAKAGDRELTLAESVTGWRPGDHVILTGTTRQHKPSKTFRKSVVDRTQTEEHTVRAIGAKLTLDKPLTYDHRGSGAYRAEVANLSRNVVVESADPRGERGHTMFHKGSAGAISYAEFRHLGKAGVLGRYSLHYHLVRDSMRGSYVIGASIHDSHNRWLTIHGTNYLVVRDCVGYRSLGHGFFLEDGTEVFNVLDRNLAVQALATTPLPRQVIPFDKNDGSGFWWANSLNSFTRNVAAECDEYGFFFQVAKTADFDPVRRVQQPDGSYRKVDVRTLPFVRFEDNEAHCQRRHGFNLGGGVPFGKPNVDGVGPDRRHPFVIRNLKVWNVHWAIHPVAPSLLLDGLDVHDADYGVWRPVYNGHAYRSVRMAGVPPQQHYAFVQGPPAEAKALDPVDDLPPTTVITHVTRVADGKVRVRGTTADNGTVKRVVVNGQLARPLAPNFAEWEATLEGRTGALTVTAHAEDQAGNVEKAKHVVTVPAR